MNTNNKFCHTCHAVVINQTNTVIKSSLRLTHADSTIYICIDCCKVGLHTAFEDKGYTQAGFNSGLDN